MGGSHPEGGIFLLGFWDYLECSDSLLEDTQYLEFLIHLRHLLRCEVPCHQLLHALRLLGDVLGPLFLDLFENLDVDGSLRIPLVLPLRERPGRSEVRVLHAIRDEALGNLVKLENRAHGWELHTLHAQPLGHVLGRDLLKNRRGPSAILLVVPGRRLSRSRVRESLELGQKLARPLEHQIRRVALDRDLIALAKVVVVLVAVLGHGHFAHQEVRHLVRQLAELLEGILLLPIGVCLVELDQPRQSRDGRHLVEGEIVQLDGTRRRGPRALWQHQQRQQQ
mmetsp:Transcript_92195/g.264246  ORF Transcript_92195/g.264246 Transcript_92195/m.264246 type:complete len:280 (+) Transcript_92195:14-853(+)